ncbi:MAG: M18 family aminopeptidase, partial [Lachnospiraceae bacterium]|nr:M18 family aminopeptidase [Lachnospiraceae bacterium]
YITRNESSIISFRIPGGVPSCYHITASHSDSPAFVLKKAAAKKGLYAKASVEKYGGMIMSTWLDRPLGLAGRIITGTESGVGTKLFDSKKEVMVIPNLAIHFNREINEGYKYNPHVDMQPVYGIDSDIMKYIAAKIEADTSDIIQTDLQLYCSQKAVTVGLEDEFYMSPRIDDLASAFLSLKAYMDGNEPESIPLWCMFDNEEVGSGTRQGAMGTFLSDIMYMIENTCSEDITDVNVKRFRNSGLLISVDNAHATHPNLPGKSDEEHPVTINGGVVIKHNANQKYTTTGLTSAVFEKLCKRADVPVQHFANRADVAGGSTLGNLLSRQVSMPMLDIGLAQLAMHSAVETAGTDDACYMYRALKAFYDSAVCQTDDGRFVM